MVDAADNGMTIFKHICNIITTPEFNVANADFFKLNSVKFAENVDENSHEHM